APDLARRAPPAAWHLCWSVAMHPPSNPRKEADEHYYNAVHSKLLEPGLRPHLLSEELIDTMLLKIAEERERIDRSVFVQHVRWVPKALEAVGPGRATNRASSRA